MKVFPAWADYLGLGDAVIRGMDFPLHAEPEAYREAVGFIKSDPLSLGALVTTHKIDLFDACRDFFDEIDPFATQMKETSCLSKRDGRLICHAKDPITSGLAIDGFLGPDYFARTGADVFSMGAGGSTIALTWHLMRRERGADIPRRIVVSNRSQPRLDEIRAFHREIDTPAELDYVLAPDPRGNDAVLPTLKPGSLVINATGLGKDAPGSPLTDAAQFPEEAIAWDLNYRGNLVFLDQARAQAGERQLRIEDGWTYFIYGWTQVIAEVFDVAIPTGNDSIAPLTEIAVAATRA
jgi:shikimate 5-dehydrogenase